MVQQRRRYEGNVNPRTKGIYNFDAHVCTVLPNTTVHSHKESQETPHTLL